MTDRAERSVVLPRGHTGSSLFHAILLQAVARFPGALASVQLPASAGAFKRDYGRLLAGFEAARAGAAERAEIARFMYVRTQEELCFGNEDARVPLATYLREHLPPPRLEQATLTGRPGLRAEIPLDGKLYAGSAIAELAEELFAAHQLTDAARRALTWVAEHARDRGGLIDLRGQRFVLLGAGAELASTRLLLAAGADVLWVDVTPPFRSLTDVNDLSGTISRAPGESDLLAHPREIAAAIRSFAGGQPVHVGMFAYAPGASKEWRLGAAMNAIVSSLEPEIVRSVALLISPTMPTLLSEESLRAIQLRREGASAWQRALERVGAIEGPGFVRRGAVHVNRSTVSLQGLSYQAAQYLSKLAAAETYAVYGAGLGGEAAPITVSANVAGITRTRSLAHPLFELAFAGASRFGVRIFKPETTRALNGLLMLHDLLNPAAPGAREQVASSPRDKASQAVSQQVHGGIATLPYVLEGVIRAAALVGLASKPTLLFSKPPRPPRSSLPPVQEAAE